jgi:hypothetical protein
VRIIHRIHKYNVLLQLEMQWWVIFTDQLNNVLRTKRVTSVSYGQIYGCAWVPGNQIVKGPNTNSIFKLWQLFVTISYCN